MSRLSVVGCQTVVRSLSRPHQLHLLLSMELPYSDAAVGHSNHFAHSFGLGSKRRKLQETTDEASCFVLARSQADQTAARMTKVRMVETYVSSEKSQRVSPV